MKDIVRHHRSYNPEMTIPVCLPCHELIHHSAKYIYLDPIRFFKMIEFENYEFDEVGNFYFLSWSNGNKIRDRKSVV
jgi:hypothetical protein